MRKWSFLGVHSLLFLPAQDTFSLDIRDAHTCLAFLPPPRAHFLTHQRQALLFPCLKCGRARGLSPRCLLSPPKVIPFFPRIRAVTATFLAPASLGLFPQLQAHQAICLLYISTQCSERCLRLNQSTAKPWVPPQVLCPSCVLPIVVNGVSAQAHVLGVILLFLSANIFGSPFKAHPEFSYFLPSFGRQPGPGHPF